MLALLAAVGLYFALRYAGKLHQARKRRVRLARFVDGVEELIDPLLSPQKFLSSLNRIFKIVALRAFPKSQCARMQGREWAEFVRENMPGAETEEDLSALANGPYQPLPVFDAESLVSLARAWIWRYG